MAGYLNLPDAAGARASTPDHDDFDISGDLDLRVLAYFVNNSGWQALIAKGDVPAVGCYALLRINASSAFRLLWTDPNYGERQQDSTTGLVNAEQTWRWYRVTLDVNNGAGQHVVTFYYSDEDATTAPSAITWTQHSQHVISGTTSIRIGSELVWLGDQMNEGDTMYGRIGYAEVRSGLTSPTVVANPDFRYDCQQDSPTQLTDDYGKVWTVVGTASWVSPLPCGAAVENRQVTIAATITRTDDFNGALNETGRAVAIAATVTRTDALVSQLEEYTDVYQDQYYGAFRETDSLVITVQAIVTATEVQSGIATEIGRLVTIQATVSISTQLDLVESERSIVVVAVVLAVDNLTQAGGPPPPPVVIPPLDILSAPALSIVAGLELLDANDQVLEDISVDLVGGAVARSMSQDIHGLARFTMARAINWHSQRLRPYLTITELIGGASQRWDLGIYLPETPMRRTGLVPATFEVEAYDKLVILANPHGIGYTIAAGSAVVAAIEALLDEQSLAHNIEPGSTVLAAARSWPLDADTTTLGIINDLLTSIGYVRLWVDRSGIFRSGPIRPPAAQTPVWHYDTSHARTVVGESLIEELDLFNVPNRWTFVRDDPALAAPSEGDGIYTVTNATDGPTSIASRGRVINRVELLDAADQAALIAQGNELVQQDRQPFHYVEFTSVPNPNHWHNDSVTISSAELGLVSVTFAEQDWTLPLDGSDMTHKVRRAVTV